MFFVIIMIFGILLFPENAIESGKIGVNLCINSIIPALFPFFVLQDILMKLGFGDFLSKILGKPFKKVFKSSNPTPFLLGVIGGYPIGAKVISSLYKEKKIDKNEAEHLLTFCVNAGPSFIIGFVGSYIFKSSKIGYVLAFSHIFSAVLVGFLFSLFKKPSPSTTHYTKVQKKPLYMLVIESVNQGFMSILSVSAFVVFFNVIVEILFCLNFFRAVSLLFTPILTIFGANTSDLSSLIIGIFEMTNGLNYLVTSTSNLNILTFIASFILAFGGISVHFQTLNFCSGLNVKKYFLAKFIQGIFAGVITVLSLKNLRFTIDVGNFGENFRENLILEYNFKIFLTFLLIATSFLILKKFAKIAKKVYNNKKT